MKITNLRIKTRETIAIMDITNDVNLRWVRSVSKTSPSPKAAGPLSKLPWPHTLQNGPRTKLSKWVTDSDQ